MSGPSRPKHKEHGDDIEALVAQYLSKACMAIPQTPKEVEAAEEWLARDDTEVPDALLNADGCSLVAPTRSLKVLKLSASGKEVAENLARAAREKGHISTDVGERMASDREQQEREKHGDK